MSAGRTPPAPPPPQVDESVITTIERGAPRGKKRWPIAPKAHGAWLGAGTGQAVASTLVQVIEGFTHQPLDMGFQSGIYLVSSAGIALLGAYLAPHQTRELPHDPDLTKIGNVTITPQ